MKLDGLHHITMSAVDEDPDHLGETLKLPRRHEHLRPQLERMLTPLVNPRARRRSAQA
jgi:hypothetical protein